MWFRAALRHRDSRAVPSPDYYRTAVTTAGHARRTDIDGVEVIKRNTATARGVLLDMAQRRAISPIAVFNPVDLGYVRGWGQVEYMRFFLASIAGLDLGKRPANHNVTQYERRLGEAFDQHEVNFALMGNPNRTAADRAPEYFKFALAHHAANLAMRRSVDSSPVSSVRALIDTSGSLGSQTERVLARVEGIPTFNFQPMLPAGDIREVFGPGELMEDLETIIRYGATICNIAEGSSFGLVEDRGPVSVTAV